MRRVQFILLASMLTTAGGLLAACGSSVSDTSGSGGGNGSGGAASNSASSTTTSSVGGGVMDAGNDADNGHPSKTYPAPHPLPPNVVNCTGGPVLKAPTVYPIFFPGDAMEPNLTDFVANIGATDYWTANTVEYGVGALTSGAAIDLTEAAPSDTTDDDIQQWLADHISGALLPQFPAPDANTLYAIYYPATTRISLQGSESCQSFGGYHNNINIGSQAVAYSVMPRCDGFLPGAPIQDDVTAASSHEFLEAATDPYPANQNPPSGAAYCQVDNNHFYWLLALGGGETGDMCAQDFSSFTKFPPFPYLVQRSWSNRSANFGHDPCVPIPDNSAPYFNSAPVFKDQLSVFGGQISLPGVKIAEGASGTVEVDLFSDGDTGSAWQVDAQGLSTRGGPSNDLSFAWDRNTGENGEKLHLTITVNSASQFGAEMFVISSRLGSDQHFWYGIVGQD